MMSEQLRRAAKPGVCKINIDSDGRLAMTAVIRKIFSESPSEFDPRKYLGPARDELIAMIKGKNINVLGSANRV
jgi:fructose-bisphosphate aldolase class II